MLVPQPADGFQSAASHEQAQACKIKINDVLRCFKRRPPSTHNFSQYTADIGRSENNMTAGQSVFDELSHKCQRIVNMLDDLRRYYAMKFEIGWQLLDAADKHFGFRAARNLRDVRRELSSETALEKRPGFIEQESGPTTNFQKLTTSESTFAQIQEKSTERCP